MVTTLESSNELQANQLAWIVVQDEDWQVAGVVSKDLGGEFMIKAYLDWYESAEMALQIEDSEVWESTLRGWYLASLAAKIPLVVQFPGSDLLCVLGATSRAARILGGPRGPPI